MRKWFRVKIELLIALCLYPAALLAHQPRLVHKQTDILVDLPEISKAYYGTLAGKPAIYRIEAAEPFKLYVNVLVPNIAGIGKDVSARIRRQGTVIAVMHPGGRDWKPFFEPFSGQLTGARAA